MSSRFTTDESAWSPNQQLSLEMPRVAERLLGERLSSMDTYNTLVSSYVIAATFDREVVDDQEYKRWHDFAATHSRHHLELSDTKPIFLPEPLAGADSLSPWFINVDESDKGPFTRLRAKLTGVAIPSLFIPDQEFAARLRGVIDILVGPEMPPILGAAVDLESAAEQHYLSPESAVEEDRELPITNMPPDSIIYLQRLRHDGVKPTYLSDEQASTILDILPKLALR